MTVRRLLTAAALAVALATPSAAQWAVYDGANHAENILQTARALEQIRRQIEQLETMYKNLERISNPSWRDLRDYMLYLNELAAQGEALAYSTEGVFERFRETMVGFVPMEPGLDYGEVYSAWMATTLDTLAATLDSVSAQSQDYLSTQDQIAELQALANSSSGNLEALNVSNMLQSHVGQEIAKLNQLLSASINAQNVYWGLTLTLEANHEATERWLIEESLEDFHVYDGQGGFTGVPGGWPYACGGVLGLRRSTPLAVSAALVAGFVIAACGPPAEPDEPLASLAWPEPSTKFTAEYWGEQAKADSKIWREAGDWCAEEARKLLPNCQTVGQVRFVRALKDSAGRQSETYDGKGGVEMPPAIQQQLDQGQTADDPPAPPGAEPLP